MRVVTCFATRRRTCSPRRCFELWPGARFAIGPAIAGGFYYDFELPGGARFPRRGPRAHRGSHPRDLRRRSGVRPREEHDFEEGLELFAEQPYKREIIEQAHDAKAQLEEDLTSNIASGAGAVSTYRNDGFVDLCRGPHVPSTDRPRPLQVDAGRRRVLARRRASTATSADLRDGLGVGRSARCIPGSPRRGRENRDHRRLGAELDLFSFPEEIGSEARCSTPRVAWYVGCSRTTRAVDTSRAGTEFVNSPHITKEGLLPDLGAPRLVLRGDVPPDGTRRRPSLLPEADELPVPHPDLQEPTALLP